MLEQDGEKLYIHLRSRQQSPQVAGAEPSTTQWCEDLKLLHVEGACGHQGISFSDWEKDSDYFPGDGRTQPMKSQPLGSSIRWKDFDLQVREESNCQKSDPLEFFFWLRLVRVGG